MKRVLGLSLVCALAAALGPSARAAEPIDELVLNDFRLSAEAAAQLQARWVDDLLATYPVGSVAPLRVDLDDADLDLMGLPSVATLASTRYDQPYKAERRKPPRDDGGGSPAPAPDGGAVTPVQVVAGTGYFGIRPGAWLLLISGNSVGWCSAAHVYGSPGNYEISTAGHCGSPGDVVTMLGLGAAADGSQTPVLWDIGTISQRQDNDIGQDWALIDVYDHMQSLVSPTMAFWGGPTGEYTDDLPQPIVHYGHGIAIGTGGTPRAAVATHFDEDSYGFFGAINLGDSGSGANTATQLAVGINTHIYVDTRLREGVGVMFGTRVSQVPGTVAPGFPVALPVQVV